MQITRGKKIGKENFHLAGVVYTIDLRLDTGHTNTPTFHLFEPKYDLDVEGKTREEVRKKAEAVLTKACLTTWQPYLHLTFHLEDDRDNHKGRSRITISLETLQYEIGTRHDGSTCYRVMGQTYAPRDGLPSVEEFTEGFDEEESYTSVLVPQTPEALKIVAEVQTRLRNLGLGAQALTQVAQQAQELSFLTQLEVKCPLIKPINKKLAARKKKKLSKAT